MTVLPVVLLLLAPPAVREPVGSADWDRLEDPLARRVASLLAGDPVFSGIGAIVPLYARVPSEAGEGRPSGIAWADGRLRARFLVEDGQSYLRIVNPTDGAMLLVAGTVFAKGSIEVAVTRDAVIPRDFAALVPAAPLRPQAPGAELENAGTLPPLASGALLGALPAFDAVAQELRDLRGEDSLLPVLLGGQVLARKSALLSASAQEVGGFGGTAVGAVFLVNGRPVAAHVFARHDLFVDALPDLLLGLALAVRDEELRSRRSQRKRLDVPDALSRALDWLRELYRVKAVWGESYGAGFETVIVSPTGLTAGHAVVDQQRGLIHAAYYSLPYAPSPGSAMPVVPPPVPPGNTDETPTGFRERKPRQTVEEQRRGELNPNPGPHGVDPAPGGARPR